MFLRIRPSNLGLWTQPKYGDSSQESRSFPCLSLTLSCLGIDGESLIKTQDSADHSSSNQPIHQPTNQAIK